MEKEPLKNKVQQFVQKVENNTNDTLMDEESNEKIDINYTDIVKNSPKAKMSKVPWLIAIFLILIVAIWVGMMFFKNNPKTLFTSTIDSLFSYLEDNVSDNVYDITDGTFNLNFNINNGEELYSELSKINLNGEYAKDNANDLTYITLKSKYSDEKFINMNIYDDNKNTYVYVPSIYDNYLKSSESKLKFLINGHDVNIILDGLNSAIDKSIVDEKIYNNKEKVDIDGKTIRANKMRLTIDSKNRDKIVKTFINTLKSNDELINVLAKMKDVKNSDIKKSLDNYLTKINNKLKKYKKMDIILYTNNNQEFIKAEAITNLKQIYITSKEKGKYIYNISGNTNISGDISFKVNDSKTKYNINLSYKKVKNNQTISESNFDLTFTSKKSSEFKKPDIKQSIALEDMNELEKLGLYTKILTDPNLSKFTKYLKMN